MNWGQPQTVELETLLVNGVQKETVFSGVVGAHFLRGYQHLSIKALPSPNWWNTDYTDHVSSDR